MPPQRLDRLKQSLRRAARLELVSTYLYASDLSQIPVVVPGLDDLDIEIVARDRGLDLPAFFPGLARATISERFDRGDLCYLCRRHSTIVHGSWVQRTGRHHVADAGRRIDVAPHECWIYHCQTAPEARGRRLYPWMVTTMMRDARKDGRVRAWIYTHRQNIPSQKGIELAGFTMVGALKAIAVGPLVVPLP